MIERRIAGNFDATENATRGLHRVPAQVSKSRYSAPSSLGQGREDGHGRPVRSPPPKAARPRAQQRGARAQAPAEHGADAAQNAAAPPGGGAERERRRPDGRAGDAATSVRKQMQVQVIQRPQAGRHRASRAPPTTPRRRSRPRCLRRCARPPSRSSRSTPLEEERARPGPGRCSARRSLAGLGAAAAVVRYRYRAAIAADSETAGRASAEGQAVATASPDADSPEDANADTSVNGRVTTSGW